jgi:hypothetical protein
LLNVGIWVLTATTLDAQIEFNKWFKQTSICLSEFYVPGPFHNAFLFCSWEVLSLDVGEEPSVVAGKYVVMNGVWDDVIECFDVLKRKIGAFLYLISTFVCSIRRVSFLQLKSRDWDLPKTCDGLVTE